MARYRRPLVILLRIRVPLSARDDSVHFKILGYAGTEYEGAMLEEIDELNRERVRLWYVALTRDAGPAAAAQAERAREQGLDEPDRHRR